MILPLPRRPMAPILQSFPCQSPEMRSSFFTQRYDFIVHCLAECLQVTFGAGVKRVILPMTTSRTVSPYCPPSVASRLPTRCPPAVTGPMVVSIPWFSVHDANITHLEKLLASVGHIPFNGIAVRGSFLCPPVSGRHHSAK